MFGIFEGLLKFKLAFNEINKKLFLECFDCEESEEHAPNCMKGFYILSHHTDRKFLNLCRCFCSVIMSLFLSLQGKVLQGEEAEWRV